MNIESEIIATVVKAVKECYGQDVPTTMVQLQKTKAEFEGNLTLVVFPFLKVSKLKPFYHVEALHHFAVLCQIFAQLLCRVFGF